MSWNRQESLFFSAQEVAYQKASEGFEVAKVAGAMAAEVGVELPKRRCWCWKRCRFERHGVTGASFRAKFLTWPESVKV